MKFDLDEYAYLDSPIHRWQPQCKLMGLGVLIGAIAFVDDLRLLPLVIALVLGLYGLSNLPGTYWRSRIRYPGYFLLGIVGLLPFVSGPTVLWQGGIVTVYQEGCLSLLLIAGRFLAIMTLSLILFGTAPFLTLIKAMRSLGIPPVLTDMMLLSYRYLYDMAGNLTRMQQSMRLRGFGSGSHQAGRQGRSLPFIPNGSTLMTLSALIGSLLVRSYEQSERVYKAMHLRGYGARSAAPVPWTQTADRASILGLGLCCLTAASLLGLQIIWTGIPGI
jgi:cobalt/nickel transport system permease protein